MAPASGRRPTCVAHHQLGLGVRRLERQQARQGQRAVPRAARPRQRQLRGLAPAQLGREYGFHCRGAAQAASSGTARPACIPLACNKQAHVPAASRPPRNRCQMPRTATQRRTCGPAGRQGPAAVLLVLAGRRHRAAGRIHLAAVAWAACAGADAPARLAARSAAAVAAVVAIRWRCRWRSACRAAVAVAGCLACGDGFLGVGCSVHLGEGFKGIQDWSVAGAAAAGGAAQGQAGSGSTCGNGRPVAAPT